MYNDIGVEVVDLTDSTFEEWLDRILKDYNQNTAAFNFNVYDNKNGLFSIEIVGCPLFDRNDDDWASNELYASRDHFSMYDYYCPEREIAIHKICKQIAQYLAKGEYAYVLKKSQAVTCGFIDGDLMMLYHE